MSPAAFPYKIGTEIWLVPADLVTTAFTSAVLNINALEPLTAEQLVAFEQVAQSTDKYVLS